MSKTTFYDGIEDVGGVSADSLVSFINTPSIDLTYDDGAKTLKADLTPTALDSKENSLGLPDVDGKILSSDILGNRVWVEQADSLSFVVVDTLDSASTVDVLSSNMGRVLDEKISSLSASIEFNITTNILTFNDLIGVDTVIDLTPLANDNISMVSLNDTLIIAPSNGQQITYSEVSGKWVNTNVVIPEAGDMLRAVYDIANTGVVDNSKKVNDLTVETSVPVGALFTDTVYTHPFGDGSSHIPLSGTTNSGKVLTATSTAGVHVWSTPIVPEDYTDDEAREAVASALPTSGVISFEHDIVNDVYEVTLNQSVLSLNRSQIVGIGNIDNTSDINKPVSTAIQTALNGKEDSLGLPLSDDQVLVSNTAGGRSWTNVGSLSLALGITEDTAYRGDRGSAAYSHSNITTGNPHMVTKGDVGLSEVDNTSDVNKPVPTAVITALSNKSDSSHTHTKGDVGLSNVDNTSDVSKPLSSASTSALAGKASSTHSHTKADLGLNNVDNTSDVAKPVSTSQQASLDSKEDGLGSPAASGMILSSSTLGVRSWIDANSGVLVLGSTTSTAHRGDHGSAAYTHSTVTGNPHGVTKTDLTLGNVNNTSDTDKPVSTDQQTALDSKEGSLGNPTADDMVLKSTALGVRSWVEQNAGGSSDSIYTVDGTVVSDREILLNDKTFDIHSLASKLYISSFDMYIQSGANSGVYCTNSGVTELKCGSGLKINNTVGANGQVLTSTGASQPIWETLPTPTTTMHSLTDVEASSPTNGQILIWSSANNRWEASSYSPEISFDGGDSTGSVYTYYDGGLSNATSTSTMDGGDASTTGVIDYDGGTSS